jgi:hypothetical protein
MSCIPLYLTDGASPGTALSFVGLIVLLCFMTYEIRQVLLLPNSRRGASDCCLARSVSTYINRNEAKGTAATRLLDTP